MKGNPRFLRTIIASAALAGLTACGGGGNVTNVSVGGTITGLTTGTVTLSNVLSIVTAPAGTTTFKFPARVSSGLPYSVTVATQPAEMTCTPTNATGVAGTTDITNVAVTCKNNRTLGGTITGLRSNGLVLANGSMQLTVPAGVPSFRFVKALPADSTYGVSVLTQPSDPSGQTCTVSNGAGTIGASDVTSITVNCI